LSDKNLRSCHVFLIVGPSMVQEKPSSVRKFLSYRVKPNRSNVYKRITFLISGIYFTYKFVIPDIKTKQNIFLIFLKYWPSSHDFNKLVIKAKIHAKIYIYFLKFFLLYKNTIWFLFFLLALRDLAVCTNKIFFSVFFNVFKVLMKTKYFNTGFVSLMKNTNRY
jgi:hypothetical protein